MNNLFKYFVIVWLVCQPFFSFSQKVEASQIVHDAYYNVRSDCYAMTVTMKLVRPSWTREITFKTWAKGYSYGMMKILGPAKDKGISFLRIKSEGWNWLPSIDRVVKISPSQMSQSWMGSDFTNQDLLKEASIINDYNHQILGEENFQNVICYRIEAIPKPNAAVVWGKVVIWVSKQDLLERKAEYFDEDGKLINTLTYSNFQVVGGKKIATIMEMIPSNKVNQKTVVTISDANFNERKDENFFSLEKMKTLK